MPVSKTNIQDIIIDKSIYIISLAVIIPISFLKQKSIINTVIIDAKHPSKYIVIISFQVFSI